MTNNEKFKSLISKEVFVDGESLTYKEYNLNKPIGVLSFIKKYIIGLPSLIIKSFISRLFSFFILLNHNMICF